MAGRELRILPDSESACRYAAQLIVSTLSQAVAQRDRASAVLAGGSTPEPVYRQLPRFGGIDKVDWLLGDERLVESGSEDTNLATISAALFDRLGIDRGRIVAPALELSPDLVVDDYERRVGKVLARDPEHRFDLVLLGLGTDGHTASLFPRDAQRTTQRLVVSGTAPAPPYARVTLTVLALGSARLVVFLVLGEGKAAAVRRAIDEDTGSPVPASWIQPADARVLWLLDRAAGSRLT